MEGDREIKEDREIEADYLQDRKYRELRER